MERRMIEVMGRVVRQDNGIGIHGVRVELLCTGNGASETLGTTLTDREGRFHICGTFPEDPCCLLHLVLYDCEGRQIHDTLKADCGRQPAPSLDFDIALPPETLWWHLRGCASFDCPEGSVIGAEVLDDIGEAFEVLGPAQLRSTTAARECLEKSIPLIACFDRLLEDACAVLEGDIVAAGRFRDAMQLICSATSDCCCDIAEAHNAFLDSLFAPPPDQTVHTVAEAEETPDAPPSDPCNPCPPPDPTCPCRSYLIPDDKVQALVMAALQVSCRHRETARNYLEVLLDQFCRFEVIGALHRAAIPATCGDEAAAQQFRDLLEVLLKTCETGFCCCEACIGEDRAACIRDAVAAWQNVVCWEVSSIEPVRACPGDRVVICGRGFGRLPGTVVFRQKGSLAFGLEVTAEQWSDTRIEVIVPDGAGCGLVPKVRPRTFKVCDSFVDVRSQGCMQVEFEGTSPEILKFVVKDLADGACLQPGTPIRLRWKTCATDHVRVEIRNRQTGAVIAAQDPADPRGRWDFTQTNFTETTEVQVRIVASGKCDPSQVSRDFDFTFQNPPNLSVDGMEITQAIQYYRAAQHLTDPADRGPDNSLRLVTGKSAWIRVYLRSGQIPGFDGGLLRDITGSLVVERRVGGVWSQIAILNPQNGPVDARDAFVSYDAERGNIDTTLNFIVPASTMTGLLRFSVNVASPYAHCPGNTASASITADVNLTQTLNAAFITIGYNGRNATNTGNLNLPAPTLAQCQTETAWALTTFPVNNQPNVRVAGTFVTNTPLDDPRSCPGCCSPNWQPLLQQVAQLVALDQAAFPGGNWVYYGIINSGIPVNVPGCNGWGATGGLAGRPVTYAHEIGHQFGLPHARCGNAGTGNANYPIYEPYDLPVDVPANPINTTNWTMASIGEYGLDINDGSIANPNNAEDFMSYCGPRWMSLFTHNFMVNAPELTPQVIATGSGAGSARVISDDEPGFTRDTDAITPFIDIFAVAVGDNVQVTGVSRLQTRYLAAAGQQTGYIAELLDGETVVAADTVYAFVSDGCNSGGKNCDCGDGGSHPIPQRKQPHFLWAMIDNVSDGDLLRICDPAGNVVWERKRPATMPKLQRLKAVFDKKDNVVRLSWTATVDKSAEPRASVRWSADGGETWRSYTVGLSEYEAVIDARRLPGGKLRFQVLLDDGFSTVTAESGEIELPPHPPEVAILAPSEGARLVAERQLHLLGLASDVAGRVTDADDMVWTIDDKEVGRGPDIWVAMPASGTHKVSLTATIDGQAASATAAFEVLSH